VFIADEDIGDPIDDGNADSISIKGGLINALEELGLGITAYRYLQNNIDNFSLEPP